MGDKEVFGFLEASFLMGGGKMKDRGICQACSRDEQCTFSRRFPVNSCDEYQDYYQPQEE